MRLTEANEHLARLGYLALAQAQLDALERVLPAYSEWMGDCVAKERSSAHWSALRAAQFAVSDACCQALRRAGVRAALEQTVDVVSKNADVRAALARIYRVPTTLRPAALDVQLVSAAFHSAAGVPAASAGHRDDVGAAVADRTKWQIHKIHGARFAVAIEHTLDKAGRAALQIEAAERLPQSKVWDWPGKIIVQLKDPEVVEVLAVLQGRTDRAAFSHHGTRRDKSFELVAQPKSSNFLIAVRQGEVARAVPVPPSHAFSITRLALQVLQANSPGLTAADVLALTGNTPFSAGPRPS